jgi:hypothetical protein
LRLLTRSGLAERQSNPELADEESLHDEFLAAFAARAALASKADPDPGLVTPPPSTAWPPSPKAAAGKPARAAAAADESEVTPAASPSRSTGAEQRKKNPMEQAGQLLSAVAGTPKGLLQKLRLFC